MNFKGKCQVVGALGPNAKSTFWEFNPEAKENLVDNLRWPSIWDLDSLPDHIRLEKADSRDAQGFLYGFYTIYPEAFDENEGYLKFLVREDADGGLSIYQCFWSTENLLPSDIIILGAQIANFSVPYGDYDDMMPNINDVPLSWLPDVPIVQEILKSYDVPAPGFHKEPMANGQNWILMCPEILTPEDKSCLEALGMFEPDHNKDICQRYWQWAKDKSDAILKRFIKIPN